MKAQRNIIFGLALLPVVTFSSHPVLAFSITPNQPGASKQYLAEQTYKIGTQEWVTKLKPPSVNDKLPKAGTKELNDLLDPFKTKGGWTFVPAKDVPELTGSFDIEIYRAKGNPNLVGADFQLVYKPLGTDPVTKDDIVLH